MKTGEFLPDLMCPRCGTSYTEVEAPTDENIKGKFSGKQETRIISAKSKNKKYYDKQGNVTNDPDLIQDIARGATVISYHEEKVENEEKKKVIRKIK